MFVVSVKIPKSAFIISVGVNLIQLFAIPKAWKISILSNLFLKIQLFSDCITSADKRLIHRAP